MTQPTRIVCLGGGWVAISLARSLRAAIRKGIVELTVISRDDYQTTHGLIAEMLTCKIQPYQILNSLRPLLHPARLFNLEIVGIDPSTKTVLTRHPQDGNPITLPYDHLVLGIGSVQDLSRYPGVGEHAFSLKSFPECVRLRDHLLKALERASVETDPEARRPWLTFVVAGGNYAGIEVACDLVDYFRLLTRKAFPELAHDRFRVVVVEIGPRILAEMGTRHPGLVPYAERRIAALGLEVHQNVGVACVDAAQVVLTSGETIPTHTVINCTGTTGSPLLAGLECEQDARGRIVTDAFHRVPEAENIWAAGDCAAVPHPKGGTSPPLALYAQTGGRRIGKNLLRTLTDKPLLSGRFTGLGEACTLGHRCAVANLRGIPAYGWFAWLGWRLTVWMLFIPGGRRKTRLAVDWLTTAFLGRDLVHPSAGKRT